MGIMLTSPTPRFAHICALCLTSACFSPIVTPLEGDESSGTTEPPSTDATSPATGDGGLDEGSSNGEPSICGNGVLDPGEVCDDGLNDGAYGGCSEDCLAQAARCGDGLRQDADGEMCDDGDDVDGNGCNVDCVISGTMRWSVHYDAGGVLANDGSRSMAVAPDDTVLVASTTAGQDDVTLRRFSAAGESMYSESIPLQQPTQADLDVSSGFGIGMVGRFQDSGEPWIVGLTIDGAVSWTDSYPDTSYAYSIAAIVDGGFVVAGYRNDLAWLRRFGAAGNVLWTDVLPWSPQYLTVSATPDGGFVAVGALEPGAQLWLRKYSSDNAELWTHIRPEHPGPSNVSVGSDGSIFVVGTDWATYEWWVTAFNSDGGEQWSSRYKPDDPSGWADASAVAAAPGGGAFVVGSYRDPSEDVLIETLIRRYSPEGNMQWEQRIASPYVPGPSTIQGAYAVDVDSHGDVLVAGSLDTDDGTDTWLAKLAP